MEPHRSQWYSGGCWSMVGWRQRLMNDFNINLYLQPTISEKPLIYCLAHLNYCSAVFPMSQGIPQFFFSQMCMYCMLIHLFFLVALGKHNVFLFKGQWTYGPTLCLSIDTHIRFEGCRVGYFCTFLSKNSPKAQANFVCFWLF